MLYSPFTPQVREHEVFEDVGKVAEDDNGFQNRKHKTILVAQLQTAATAQKIFILPSAQPT